MSKTRKAVRQSISFPPLGHKHKALYPQFAPPETWRTRDFHIVIDGKTNSRIVWHKEDPLRWQKIRGRILSRDNHTCRYCGFEAPKWQVVHHIDGNPKNNGAQNLETVCPMCNLVLHAGRGCTVLRIVDLFKKSRHGQADVIRRTRVLRASGASDQDIITKLVLEEKVSFKMDRRYLRRLTAFVSSRPPARPDFMVRGLEYGYDEARRRSASHEAKQP